MRSLLRRLRKKLTEALHRLLRALRFRFADMRQPAERRRMKAEDGGRSSIPSDQPGLASGLTLLPAESAAPTQLDAPFGLNHGEQAGSARNVRADEPVRPSTVLAGLLLLEPPMETGRETSATGNEGLRCEGDLSSESQFPAIERHPQLSMAPDESHIEPKATLPGDEAAVPPVAAADSVRARFQGPLDRVKSERTVAADGLPSIVNVEDERERTPLCPSIPTSVDTTESDVSTARRFALEMQAIDVFQQADERRSAIELSATSASEAPVSAELEAATATGERSAFGQSDASQAVSATVPESPALIVGGENRSASADALLDQSTAKPVEPTDVTRDRVADVHPVANDVTGRVVNETARRVVRERPRAPRPLPEHYEQPFVDPHLMSPATEYALWNKAIVHHCLLEDVPEVQEVYLTITPRVLASAISDVGGGILAPEEAERQFALAVSRMYSVRVLAHSRKLQALRRCGDDGLPECAAFLALSVLAAYRMHTDEGAAANAYYRRLDELLRCGLAGGLPRGFEPDEFEGLWLFTAAWLRRNHNRQLAMPGPDVGVRRYVALPLTHVPLRQVDIERLPDFFGCAGYEPGRISIEQLDADLAKWARSGGAFTNAGTTALADERHRAVLVQVAHELECWDGSHKDPQGRRIAPVEVFLHWERRIPVLSYLPRRPAAFPSVFDDGAHVLDAGQDGWYEPLPISTDDGHDLENGFSWEAASNGIHVVLHRSGASAIAMAPSEFAGPVSHAGLLLNASGAALCREALVIPAQQYLKDVTGQRCMPLRPPNMPDGWVLFTGVKPVRQQQPPNALESLEVISDVEIIVQGGLRLGRRWAWLAEAPPRILVAGIGLGETATIDGEPVQVDQEGVLEDRRRLSAPGLHVVQVGRVRRRIEIVEPEVASISLANDAADDPRRVMALPWGAWAVIGSRPGTVLYALSRHRAQGILARCLFDPVWAISIGLSRGAVVRSLSDKPPAPERVRRLSTGRMFERVRAWADAIYYANMRHPAIAPLCLSTNCPDARAVWAEYVRVAKEIKRRLKAERR